ncbi:hypothetical protein M409DRAFT_58536 [Zasmidium cellare ATCC 36951]|uniref:Uncharacterized protein n=1 Tax=Zasmidium cellare ATCC 36951 TaxID=1080233 RepID=A0A6A6C9G3_ZASCE|nr:uncharacterized protein M409DRAFT_58536 [Zasmidium cellare ATCC 36951]KAF2162086.1 hypothetical protein M409DRAFT_58536 [Zasmidium cellare ATCC 36951]
MAKRRADSACENPIVKRPSVSQLVATIAQNDPVKATRKSTARAPLREFGPWQNASTANLRPKPRRTRESIAPQSVPTLKPGLELAGRPLETMKGEDIASVKEVILLPTTLAVIKPNWPFCFDVNCTPQLGPPLPQHIAEDLYAKYVCSSPLLRPGKLPYMHIGTTTLGFKLHFYLILPNAGGPPHAVNTGHLTDETLQTLFDTCINSALAATDPQRRGFTSWMQAMNESNLLPLKSRNRTSAPEIQEERVHCIHLDAIWRSISECEDDAARDLLDGYVLVAYGNVEGHCWHEGWKPTWGSFRKDWEAGVEGRFLREESRVVVGMELGVGVVGEGEDVGRRGSSRYERNKARRTSLHRAGWSCTILRPSAGFLLLFDSYNSDDRPIPGLMTLIWTGSH